MVVGVPQGILDIKNATVRVNTLESTDISLSSNIVNSVVVEGNTDVSRDLEITGNAAVSSNLTVSGDTKIASNLTVGTSSNLFVNTQNGKVGIGTDTPATDLHVNGDFYARDITIQTVTSLVHDRIAYSPAVVDLHIDALDITITPKFANSKILLNWDVVHETDPNAVFRIYRNTTLIGYNNTRSTIDDWNGVVAVPADFDNASTPYRVSINWVDVPATTNPITYKLYKHEADGASANIFYLNRHRTIPAGGDPDGGASNYEIGVSYVSAIEITQ
jgi:hypothetical protein